MKAYALSYNPFSGCYVIYEGREFRDHRAFVLNPSGIETLHNYISRNFPRDRKFEIYFDSSVLEETRTDITSLLQERFPLFQKASLLTPRKKR